jgi:hypothetical protein
VLDERGADVLGTVAMAFWELCRKQSLQSLHRVEWKIHDSTDLSGVADGPTGGPALVKSFPGEILPSRASVRVRHFR